MLSGDCLNCKQWVASLELRNVQVLFLLVHVTAHSLLLKIVYEAFDTQQI